jgi:hypothetical protein
MAKKKLTITIDIDELMTGFIPKIVRQYIKTHSASSSRVSEDIPTDTLDAMLNDIPDDILNSTLIEGMDDVLNKIPGASPDDPMVGTTLTLDVNLAGDVYSYSITDGVAFDVLRGKLDAPMILINIPLETLAVIGNMRYVDILLGMQTRFTRESYDLICELEGTVIFKMTDPDGKAAEISVTFNDGQAPETIVSLSLEEAMRFTAGKVSLLDLIDEGKLVVEGDMDFAVSLQKLFS